MIRFKPFPRNPDYLVSTEGDVYSKPRYRVRGGFVNPWLDRKGYLYYNFGSKIRIAAAAAVLETFVGPRPAGLHSCHYNGIPTDNRLENLRWDTPKGNSADNVRNGTRQRGARHYGSKTSDEDVREMRRMFAAGAKQTEIAAAYGLTQGAVCCIVHRWTWKHVF